MTFHTALIIEDDKITRRILRETLGEMDMVVLEADRVQRCLEILKEHQVDIILLDLILGEECGVSLINPIRELSASPLIVVSSEENKGKRIRVFEEGADDFVEKPFDPYELKARVNAHLRRFHSKKYQEGEKIGAVNGHAVIQFDKWTLDRKKFLLRDAKNEPCDLTAQEFKLLYTLIVNSERVLKREELCEAISENGYAPTPRAIDVKVTRIRKKLGDDADNPLLIKTVRGIGYMFGGDIRVET